MNKIEPGDVVSVNFHAQAYTLTPRAVVLKRPEWKGDNWLFEDTASGSIHYVTEPCTITLIDDLGDFN